MHSALLYTKAMKKRTAQFTAICKKTEPTSPKFLQVLRTNHRENRQNNLFILQEKIITQRTTDKPDKANSFNISFHIVREYEEKDN